MCDGCVEMSGEPVMGVWRVGGEPVMGVSGCVVSM